jgi:hypothetical protein
MSTGIERVGIRMIFPVLRGPDSTLTLADKGQYTIVDPVGCLILWWRFFSKATLTGFFLPVRENQT